MLHSPRSALGIVAVLILLSLSARHVEAQIMTPAPPPPFIPPTSPTPPPDPITLTSGWTLQDIAKIPDTAEKISQPDYLPPPPTSWYPATVPGTVLTSLVNAGIYPEPLYGENNRTIPESLCRTSYWYRTQLTIPSTFAGKRTWLNFEGINYTADVWVNGKQAGTIKGAFARGIFDITDLVHPGQPAAIAVKINPPPHPGTPQEQTVSLGTGPNGGDLMQDGPTFGSTVGWDWIPAIRDRDVGIWQKVTLSATGIVRLDNPSVISDLPLPRTDTADLAVIATIRNTSDDQQEGMFRGTFDGGSFQYSVILDPHETKQLRVDQLDSPVLHIKNPQLWWPNTYGQPHLYSMHLAFEINGIVSDSRDLHFGIRKIIYHTPLDQTLIPASDNLTVFVNGVPIFCKGGNWGMDEALKRIPAEALDAKVRFHALANYTMIRNWVGQSTSEDFYNACDKYGILLWDEMFQANQSDGPQVGGIPRPSDTPEIIALRQATIDMYLGNVREKILRFRSHPSIALWCGRNESYPAPQSVADALTKITAELDPTRFYQANSGDGRGVRSAGPYSWRPPAAFFPTPPTRSNAPSSPAIAPGGTTYFPPNLEPFKTELGSVSIPTLEFIKTWLPEKDWYDLNDDWASHDLCQGAQQGNLFPQALAARYGFIAARDLPDFVRKSQLAMYETYRAMYEGRMSRLFDPCTGILTWMSNPAQPSFVWQLYSYDLEPLAALYGTQKACEPLHIQMNPNDWHIMVINTAPHSIPDLKARIRIVDFNGITQSDRTLPLTAKPCATTDLGTNTFPGDLSPVHFIALELRDAAGKLLSDNFYWRSSQTTASPTTAPIGFGAGGTVAGRGRGFLGRGGAGGGTPQEDLSLLQTLPTAELQITLTRHDEPARAGENGGKCLIDATLTNPTKIVALQAHLQLRNARTNQRILPVFYSTNFISLLPGESKTLTIETDLKNLGPPQSPDTPLVVLDGWNVTTPSQTFPTNITLAPNKDAFVSPKPLPAP